MPPTATSTPTAPGSTEAGREALVARVVAWFDGGHRDLPWRHPDRTPWGVLVSEVMLQQTPVARVEPVWRQWMAVWPTPADLAAASTADVLRAWGRLGYPRRALRLHECARTVVERHGGVLPAAEDGLRALPGVGPYTAAAVVAFAHGGRSVVLDTNVRRLLARAVAGRAGAGPGPTVAEVRAAEALVPGAPDRAAAWAAASMELGAVVCTARAPRCPACPVADLCRWRAEGHPPDAPDPRRRTPGWAGTDRQVRGRVMGLLRDSPEAVPLAAVRDLWPDRDQLERCLGSLVADGLVQPAGRDDEPTLRLPT